MRRGKPLQRQRHRQQLLWGQLRALGTAGGEVPSATSGGSASAVEDVAWMNGRKMREEFCGWEFLYNADGNLTRKHLSF